VTHTRDKLRYGLFTSENIPKGKMTRIKILNRHRSGIKGGMIIAKVIININIMEWLITNEIKIKGIIFWMEKKL
jgi:hypothetical protein